MMTTKTQEKKFYNMLMQRSREAKEKPETLRRIT